MDVRTQNYVGQVVAMAINNGAHSATKYINPKTVVKATQRLRAGRVLPRKDANLDFVVTVGRPNFLDRQFIKDCIKADVAFPIQKVQLKFPAMPRVRKTSKKARLSKEDKRMRSLAATVLAQTRQRGNMNARRYVREL